MSEPHQAQGELQAQLAQLQERLSLAIQALDLLRKLSTVQDKRIANLEHALGFTSQSPPRT